MRTLSSSPCQLRLGVVLRHLSLSPYKYVIHYTLEDHWCIEKTEIYNSCLKKTLSYDKRCFSFILFFDTNIVASSPQVNVGKD